MMVPTTYLTNGSGPRPEKVGILTKTVISSPVVRFLLHARIRHRQYNDLILVGDSFVTVKHVGLEGHLEHIATKTDFDARIRAAKVFNIDSDAVEEDLLIKAEPDDSGKGCSAPPDLLVLTLSTNDVVFLYLACDEAGTLSFCQQAAPLPIFEHLLYQPGEHLAVDPQSRALAVAANEREVVIYSAKRASRIREQLRTGCPDWCPVSAQRPLQVDGVIQHMDFLFPPAADEDHIILLLIVVDQRKTKAIWIDWYYTSDLHHAQVHVGQSLDTARTVSSLLVPLRDASFLLISGNEVKKWKGILTGPATGTSLSPLDALPMHSGLSPRQPVWANWCRPRRNRAARRDKDHLYLVREDGLVFLVQSSVDSIVSSSAGHFKCHVGTAFASLGDDHQPDILAVAGDMSTGRVVSIGQWPYPSKRNYDLSWDETMEMALVETIPNWTSVLDMVVSGLPHSHSRSSRSRDGVFVTSGKQPYGCVTEMRHGLEASLTSIVELPGGSQVTGMWVMPVASTSVILLLLTSPTSTRLFQMNAELELEEMDADDELAFDTNTRTLAAAATPTGDIIQVTDKSICMTASLIANFEDTVSRTCADGGDIIAAAIESETHRIVTVEKVQGAFQLCCISFPLPGREAEFPQGRHREIVQRLKHESLAIAVASLDDRLVIALTTAAQGVMIWTWNGQDVKEACRIDPDCVADSSKAVDDVLFLRSSSGDRLMAACSLRDGRLLAVTLEIDDVGAVITTGTKTFHFGPSAPRLAELACLPSSICVMSGTDTCVLTWTGTDSHNIEITSLWLADKAQPELAQGAVNACAQLPAENSAASGDASEMLVMVSGDSLMFTQPGGSPTVVPRQIGVEGTPNRLLYAEQQRCLVCASLKAAVRSFPAASGRPEERRQIWPVIDFIPARSSSSSYTYELQPGERVYCLLEWSLKLSSEDKTYSFILVGGSYPKSSGSQRGKITFLQPKITQDASKAWRVTGVKEGRATTFDAAVYALALYDDLTYVACYGEHVVLYRFSVETARWQRLCEPLKLASSGVYVTVEGPLIHVSTNRDSLVTLRLESEEDEGTTMHLAPCSSAPQVAYGLSHLAVEHPSQDSSHDIDIVLSSTKDGQVLGFSCPSDSEDTVSHSHAAEILFEARLPSSLTRLKQGTVRPKWRDDSPSGVLLDNIVGVTTDGALIGIALLDEKLWRRLSWLQKLCEWSEDISPHSHMTPAYAIEDEGHERNERALPVGLSTTSLDRGSELAMRTATTKPTDMHIDGDILVRLLERGGTAKSKQIIRSAAGRKDRVGEWVTAHLDEELEAAESIVGILRTLLNRWL